MFNLSYTRPAEIAGTIEMERPIWSLGNHTDIHGNRWMVQAVFGWYVCAKPLQEVHPYFTSTATSSFGLVEEWFQPYEVSVNGKLGNKPHK